MTEQITSSPAGQNRQTNCTAPVKIFNMTEYLNKKFAQDIENFKNSGRLRSGFANLDSITNLYPGLYVIGAIPSLGKTTFIHQMGDQMAEAGSHVLFFSLEQSIMELASKSIARTIARQNAASGLSSLQVRRSDLSDPNIALAMEKYGTYSHRMTIAECSFRATINDIANIVREYIKKNQVNPVVIIDYLQVIQPGPELKMNTKELVDYHVRRLKELQHDHNLTMIVISSLNRQNYMAAIDFESFKESGGIEYTADVVWGLQLQCIHDSIFSKTGSINQKRELLKKAKRNNPRKIELVCLKNRFGISSYSSRFDYYPNFDLFKPDMAGLDTQNVTDSIADTDGFSSLPEALNQELPWDD